MNLPNTGMEAQPATLRQEVYECIKRDIITCALAPGQLLNEGKLAERLEVSKTPVREALTQLQQDHLVERIPRKGYLVTTIALKDIHEIFEIRLILERAATMLAAERITDAEVSRLERYLELELDPDDPSSLYRYIQANTDFHMEIAAASRNSRLARHLALVFNDAQRLQYMDLHTSEERRRIWRHGHKQIIEALRKRDKEAAAAVVESELADLLTHIMAR